MAAQLQLSVLNAATLHVDCTTVPVRLPLRYCRFVLPDGRGFSIDEQITQAKYERICTLGHY